ncbi:MAG: hypothetical protein ABIS17_11740 [Casimicrobiaceae bacterium]
MHVPADLPGVPDPRVFPSPSAATPAAQWYALAAATLSSQTPGAADAEEAALRAAMATALRNSPVGVAEAIDQAPSPSIGRQIWRTVAFLWDQDAPAPDQGELRVTAFALPLVIVAGRTAGDDIVQLPGVLSGSAPARIAAILRDGNALGGNESLAVSPVLVSAAAVGIEQFAAWRALRGLPSGIAAQDAHPLFHPAPLPVSAGPESVHLRFLVGTALAAVGRDLLAGSRVGRWGAALTAALVEELAAPGTSVLALPRVPGHPLPAAQDGAAAQREVGAQLFATHAIRKLRASVGEPTAVISSHRAADARGGGELRLSLSSPFAPRDAEGFRCPLLTTEPVSTPLRMLTELLRDCRVTDVRLLASVHADRVPGTGMPLFFKADTIPEGALLP